MYWLTDEQIATVVREVENEGINFSHLGADLVDHICCEIESHMNNGISFNEAYGQVKMKFGIKGLRQIQQDTLMLIDKNYRIMKNSMKTIGMVSLALMAIGILFKIMHWPYAGIMLTISYVAISLVFLPSLLYVMYRDVNQKRQAILYIVAFISGLIFFAGVLFKVMHWPFANLIFFLGIIMLNYVLLPLIIIMRINKLKINKTVFLIGIISLMIVFTGFLFKINHWPAALIILDLGAIFMVLVFIPLYYIREVRSSEKLRLDFLFGIIIVAFFLVLTFLQNIAPSNSLQLDSYYSLNSYKANASSLNSVTQELIKKDSLGLATKFVNHADLICQEIEEIEIQIYQKNSQLNKVDAIKQIENGNLLNNNDIHVNFLLSENNQEAPLLKLKQDMTKFCNLYLPFFKDSLMYDVQLSHLLNTDDLQTSIDGKPMSWEDYYFKNMSATAAINMLSFWKYNIRLIENKAIFSIVENFKN